MPASLLERQASKDSRRQSKGSRLPAALFGYPYLPRGGPNGCGCTGRPLSGGATSARCPRGGPRPPAVCTACGHNGRDGEWPLKPGGRAPAAQQRRQRAAQVVTQALLHSTTHRAAASVGHRQHRQG